MSSTLPQSAGNAAQAATLEKFPDFSPRDDMQNSLHLDDDAHQAILRQHLGNYDSTIVLGEIPVRWTPRQQEGHRIPDLLVAFNVNRALAVEQKGYSIRDQGKPPDLVLEVASESTGDNDIGDKRRDYANFGIPEYWRYDPSGGSRHDAPLGGDRLTDGIYEPVEIVEVGPEHFHGYSVVLGLTICWDHGRLRWYDPTQEQHLMTFQEEMEARIAAEARVRELEEQLKVREES